MHAWRSLTAPFSFVLDRMRRVALRFALGRGIKAAASMAFGINVRGLRFRPLETGRPPYGVFEYPIPVAAAQQLEEHLRRSDPEVLREIRTALSAPTIDGLAGHLRRVFTGVGLAHGEYYSHSGMIDVCARALKVDPQVWRRLDEQRLWAQVEAGGIVADGLPTGERGPLPNLFVLSDPPWTSRPGVSPAPT